MKKAVKIMVFGTFDGVHPGHLDFFAQARSLAQKSTLVVSIARDTNVRNIKKRRPFFSEKERMRLVQKTGMAERVVLAGLADHLPHILKEKPDIIALGYDQKAYVKDLKKNLRKAGLSVSIVRLKSFKPRIYKSHLLKKAGLL